MGGGFTISPRNLRAGDPSGARRIAVVQKTKVQLGCREREVREYADGGKGLIMMRGEAGRPKLGIEGRKTNSREEYGNSKNKREIPQLHTFCLSWLKPTLAF